MDTVRVDLVYRPLRVCWVIAPGDVDAFRNVVRLNFTLWGGRFSPIVIVDGTEQPDQLVEAFRADIILGYATDASSSNERSRSGIGSDNQMTPPMRFTRGSPGYWERDRTSCMVVSGTTGLAQSPGRP
jgi:hypothetical protein